MQGHETQILSHVYGNTIEEIARNKQSIIFECSKIAAKESDYLIACDGGVPYYSERDFTFRDDIRFETKMEALDWLESVWDKNDEDFLNSACLYKEYKPDGTFDWFWLVGYEYHI